MENKSQQENQELVLLTKELNNLKSLVMTTILTKQTRLEQKLETINQQIQKKEQTQQNNSNNNYNIKTEENDLLNDLLNSTNNNINNGNNNNNSKSISIFNNTNSSSSNTNSITNNTKNDNSDGFDKTQLSNTLNNLILSLDEKDLVHVISNKVIDNIGKKVEQAINLSATMKTICFNNCKENCKRLENNITTITSGLEEKVELANKKIDDAVNNSSNMKTNIEELSKKLDSIEQRNDLLEVLINDNKDDVIREAEENLNSFKIENNKLNSDYESRLNTVVIDFKELIDKLNKDIGHFNNYNDSRNKVFDDKLSDVTNEVGELKSNININNDKFEELSNDTKIISDKISNIIENSKTIENKLLDVTSKNNEVNAIILSIRKTNDDHVKEISSVKETITSLEKSIEKNSTDCLDCFSKISILEESCLKNKLDIESYNKINTEIKISINALEIESKGMKENKLLIEKETRQVEDLLEKYNDDRDKVIKIEESMFTIVSDINGLLENKDFIIKQLSNNTDRTDKLESMCFEIQDNCNSRDKKILEMQGKVDISNSSIDKINLSINNNDLSIDKLNKELTEIIFKINEIKSFNKDSEIKDNSFNDKLEHFDQRINKNSNEMSDIYNKIKPLDHINNRITEIISRIVLIENISSEIKPLTELCEVNKKAIEALNSEILKINNDINKIDELKEIIDSIKTNCINSNSFNEVKFKEFIDNLNSIKEATSSNSSEIKSNQTIIEKIRNINGENKKATDDNSSKIEEIFKILNDINISNMSEIRSLIDYNKHKITKCNDEIYLINGSINEIKLYNEANINREEEFKRNNDNSIIEIKEQLHKLDKQAKSDILEIKKSDIKDLRVDLEEIKKKIIGVVDIAQINSIIEVSNAKLEEKINKLSDVSDAITEKIDSINEKIVHYNKTSNDNDNKLLSIQLQSSNLSQTISDFKAEINTIKSSITSITDVVNEDKIYKMKKDKDEKNTSEELKTISTQISVINNKTSIIKDLEEQIKIINSSISNLTECTDSFHSLIIDTCSETEERIIEKLNLKINQLNEKIEYIDTKNPHLTNIDKNSGINQEQDFVKNGNHDTSINDNNYKDSMESNILAFNKEFSIIKDNTTYLIEEITHIKKTINENIREIKSLFSLNSSFEQKLKANINNFSLLEKEIQLLECIKNKSDDESKSISYKLESLNTNIQAIWDTIALTDISKHK